MLKASQLATATIVTEHRRTVLRNRSHLQDQDDCFQTNAQYFDKREICLLTPF